MKPETFLLIVSGLVILALSFAAGAITAEAADLIHLEGSHETHYQQN